VFLNVFGSGDRQAAVVLVGVGDEVRKRLAKRNLSILALSLIQGRRRPAQLNLLNVTYLLLLVVGVNLLASQLSALNLVVHLLIVRKDLLRIVLLLRVVEVGKYIVCIIIHLCCF
jgi:hypothetical protein